MVETEPSRPRETLPTVQFGGGPIMLWGYGPSAGTGSLIKVEGGMDSSQRRSRIPSTRIQTLTGSYRKPLEAVNAAKGGSTKY